MVADLPQPERPERRLGRLGRRGPLVVVLVSFVLLVSLLLGRGPTVPPSSSPVAAGTGSPSGPIGTSGPSPSPGEPWERLTLEPFQASATLAPEARDAAGIMAETSFVLGSLTTEPAAALAERLVVTPQTALRIAAGADASQVTLTPTAPMRAGQLYRFALRGHDGTLAGSWAFSVRAPLRVLATLPGDRTTGVPTTTGIEVTFEQEGAADIGPYFSINPTVDGRFERHGRTQVFVPSSLAPSTAYTVTIRAGLPRTGTELKLEHDVVFRFETAGPGATDPRWIIGRDVIESSPSEAPVIGIVARAGQDTKGEDLAIPASADVRVYRYPSEAAATSALQAFLASPRWVELSSPTLAVEDLPLELSFTATLEVLPDPYDEVSKNRVIRFPATLPKGWYAVEIAGERPAYAFLQVTRVSAWVSVLTDRTIVWVNDVVGHRPIAGATAALPGKSPLGTSGTDGILNAPTPAALLTAAVAEGTPPPPAPVLVVRSGQSALLVPFDVPFRFEVYRGEWGEGWFSGDGTYWSVLSTDRSEYRTTDSAAIWGYLRARDADTAPQSADIRIVNWSSAGLDDPPALAAGHVEPDAFGVFTLQLPFEKAPLDSYVVQVVVDGRVVASRYIQITVLRKPEYQLAIATDHRAAISGTTVGATATATFFDGTAAPGVPLQYANGNEPVQFGPTNAHGVASAQVPMVTSEDFGDDAQGLNVWVAPSGPESGEISASADVLVFPASEQLDASGGVTSGRLRVTGTLRDVDLGVVERELAEGTWNGSPGGGAIVGRSVSVVVTELIPVRTKTGTYYDFIEKVVVPTYRYSTERKALGSKSIVSGADGRIVVDMVVPTSAHQYEVIFSTKDTKGRGVRRMLVVGAELEAPFDESVSFEAADGTSAIENRFAVGERIAWTMTSNGETLPSGGVDRYLYLVAQRGLVAAATSDSSTFKRTFRASDAPGVFVMGVRFTGTTYAPKAAAWADFDVDERRIDVTITADRDGYRPGDDIKLTVRTAGAGGVPVSADVVLLAVDEKLYAMGAAFTPDPLAELYQRVDSGVVRLTATHQVPTGSGGEGEGGDGGGGGPRTDFRDMLAFVRLHTNVDGVAGTTIKASDDLTAWHFSASALTADLEAGVGELLVQVGLPLFASVTVADDYLVTDRPAVRLRAFGQDLRPGDPVVFTISSAGLGLAATTIRSTAFTDTWFDLPTLRLGQQSLDVAVVAPNRRDAGGNQLTDRLIVSFGVIESRLTVARTGYGRVGELVPTVPGSAAATYTFTDAGRARYVPLLIELTEAASMRLDRGLAGTLARTMLEAAFGWDATALPPDTFDLSRYPIQGPTDYGSGAFIEDWRDVGIGLLPYGGVDPWLATRVAIADPESEAAGRLREALGAIRDDRSLPRDLRIAAIAGLAGLGDPVLADVAELRAEADLSIFESIHLGLAAAALGDEATARSIERALLEAHGQRLGPWVRINAQTSRDDTAEMTALLAMLAARVGDPLAAGMLDYVSSHPSAETSHALEAAATIAALLERMPAAPASFAYSVAGKRVVVDIKPGGAVTIALTAPQRASLVLEQITGDVGVAVAWHEDADVAAIDLDATISVTRTAQGAVAADRLVVVDLTAAFTKEALEAGCYVVVEQVPSGLAPLAQAVGQGESQGIVWPSEVVGQQVTFCVPRGVEGATTTVSLRYVARIISTGTFTWEPAIMTVDGIPEVVTVSGASIVRVGD